MSASDPVHDGGRYEDHGELGRGGMGVIRRVFDRVTLRWVAMKIPKSTTDAMQRAAFLAEARIVAQLDHPNIAPIYDLVHDADGTVRQFTMKVIEGRPLSALLAGRRTPPARDELDGLLRVLLHACDALSFAHSRGVIHRDVNPSNLVVGSHEQVYVTDWGLALLRDVGERSVRLGTDVHLPPAPIAGTPAYMAPEQVRGALSEIDERTDVFGLGGVLYEMLTLRAPYDGDDVRGVIERARRGLIVPPEDAVPDADVPAGLAAICRRALARDRADRYVSVDALRADLEQFLRAGGWFPVRRFERGALLMREGESGDRAYIVTDGRCEVFRIVDGERRVLRVVGPGEVVGEVALFGSGARIASVEAVTDVSTMVVTRDALDRELDRATWLRSFVQAVAARMTEAEFALRGPGA